MNTDACRGAALALLIAAAASWAMDRTVSASDLAVLGLGYGLAWLFDVARAARRRAMP